MNNPAKVRALGKRDFFGFCANFPCTNLKLCFPCVRELDGLLLRLWDNLTVACEGLSLRLISILYSMEDDVGKGFDQLEIFGPRELLT